MKIEGYQNLVKKLFEERGFVNDSVEEAFLLLSEEVGINGKYFTLNQVIKDSF